MYEVNGYEVRFKHYRYNQALDGVIAFAKHGMLPMQTVNYFVKTTDARRPQPFPSLHGGKTECYIIDPVTGGVIADGIALCSWRDNFCRKIGRDISFGRAVKRLEEMRERNDTSCGGAE